MFDDVFRKLRQFERGIQIPIELSTDAKGYLDRKCPSKECRTAFKVMYEDWRNIVRDEEVFCTLCRHKAKSTEWNTPEQDRYIEQVAKNYVSKELGKAFQSDARHFNRSQRRDSFISITMSYKQRPLSVPVPAKAADIMTQEFSCEICTCRFASIGAAFFCPSCGHNSILDTFANSIDTVRKTLAAIPEIRVALTKANDENVAEDSIRHICENGLTKIVSSFQRYAEACFLELPNTGSFTVRQNLFQNLSESDAIWRQATGTGYSDLLGRKEYDRLSLYFQQRHVFSHLDGIVDQQYIDRSNDQRFDVGQRLVVLESSVSDLANIIKKLAIGLSALL